jgi:hypothetical protein
MALALRCRRRGITWLAASRLSYLVPLENTIW